MSENTGETVSTLGDIIETIPSTPDEAVSALGDIMEEGIAGFTLNKLLAAVIVAAVSLVIIKLLLKLTNRALDRSTHLDYTVRRLIRGGVKALLVAIAVIIVMTCLGIEATSLIAVLSVAGLALSLALQNFLSNVAGGFQILASQPFKPGDWVDAAGCSGTVSEIGMFYTKLKSIDNKLIQLPNSSIVASNIVNYSSEPKRQVEVRVEVSYDSDLEQVRATLAELVGTCPLTYPSPEPLIHVYSYKDSSIEFIVRVWCDNKDYWSVYYYLMDGLKPALDAADIEISYPHVNVHMIEDAKEAEP